MATTTITGMFIYDESDTHLLIWKPGWTNTSEQPVDPHWIPKTEIDVTSDLQSNPGSGDLVCDQDYATTQGWI